MELHRINEKGLLESVKKDWVAFGPKGTQGIAQFQSGPATVTCAVGATEGINGANVTVREGVLYRLDLFAAVPQDTSTAPFISRFAPNVLGPVATEPAGFHLTSATSFLIEVATDTLPKEVDIRNACRAAFEVERATVASSPTQINEVDRVRVWFDPRKVDTAQQQSFRYVQRVELAHQAWRWNGRPSKTHPHVTTPDFASPSDDNNLLVWEAVEFGDRDSIESVPHEMPVFREKDAVARAKDTLFKERPDVRCFRWEMTPRDPKGRYDERGQHHRFALRAYSRYEGLMTPGQTIENADPSLPKESISAISRLYVNEITDGSGEKKRSLWMSLFVPSRRQDSLPPPKVKLILPLTQGEPEDSLHFSGDSLQSLEKLERSRRTAGLLVILNEPWYEVGGLGEGIEARVELAPNPDEDPTKVTPENRTYYFQAGPDTTVNVKQFADGKRLLTEKVKANDNPIIRFDPNLILGPVGHYFDADNNSALFVGTSFILPPPTLPQGKEGPAPFYMAKVSFRRTLATRYMPEKDGSFSFPDPSWKPIKRYSPYCDALWVQYLPEFSIYDDFGEHVSALRLNLSGNDGLPGKLRLQNGNGGTVSLTPTKSDNSVFSLYLILNRMVVDVMGRPDQEAYLQTFGQGAGGEWTPLAGAFTSDPRIRYRARLVEVQRPVLGPGAAGGTCWSPPKADLWKEMFYTPAGVPVPCDSPGRVVRMSEPIDSVVLTTVCEVN
jgi:hypothetical protein